MTDGPGTYLGEIVVIGPVAVPGMPKGGGGGGGGGLPETPIRTIDQDEPPPEPQSVWTEEAAQAENERLKECAAATFTDRVNALAGDRGKKVEHFSISWRKNGEIVTSDPREATGRYQNLPIGSAVTSADFNRLTRDHSITPGSIVSFNHSHAAEIYCNGSGLTLQDQRTENRYPSARDAVFADALIGANVSPEDLTLYVMDCEGTTRGFPYRADGGYRSQPLPPPIAPDDCASSGGQ